MEFAKKTATRTNKLALHAQRIQAFEWMNIQPFYFIYKQWAIGSALMYLLKDITILMYLINIYNILIYLLKYIITQQQHIFST